ARFMELTNAINDYLNSSSSNSSSSSSFSDSEESFSTGASEKKQPANKNNCNSRSRFVGEVLRTFIVMLSPFAPHFSEEWWEKIGGQRSVFLESWPQYVEKFLTLDEISMAVMINGKLRDQITVSINATDEDIVNAAKNSKKIEGHLAGKILMKKIAVPQKLINFIVK
ncbi:MAG: class I tRNA ligase family protein, partial [Oligoflexia bacterium]|nr:class I tRNA ligase family protein [Oligoflexia bacterium]